MRRVAVYAGTRNIYHNMTVAAKSLLSHTRMDRVWFLIEDDVFPEPLPDVIRCANMSGQAWFDPEGPNFHKRWTYMTNMRLVLPEIMPEEERVLWLDVDTVVEQDIATLFDTDLEGMSMAAVVEPLRGGRPFVYYNAGVLLMELGKMRKWQGELVRTVNLRPLDFPDQDAINLRMQGEILPIHPRWNSCDWTANVEKPMIRHFAADKEYWNREGYRKYDTPEWRVKDAD